MPIAKRIAVDSARKPVILFSSSTYDQNVRWRATLPDKTKAVGPFSAFYSLGANNLIHIAVPARTARPPILPLDDIGAAFVVKDSTGQKARLCLLRGRAGPGDRRPSCSARMRRG